MKTIKKLLYFVLLVGNLSVFAQQDLTLYYMENVPQRQYLNPAFRPNSSLNIGLPTISSIYVNHINTTFTPNNLFEVNGNTTTLAVDNFKSKIRNNNYIGVNSKIDLLSFGFKVKKNYFSFNITENVFSRVNFSRGFLEFPLYGNADFDHHGGVIDLKNTGVNFSHYREFALGWQREINEKLNIGVKGKYLVGKSNVWTKTNTFKIETNETDFDWNISGELDARSSGFDTNSALMNEDIEGYMFNDKNKGFAVDLGATYQLNKKINLDASIVDLGFINWNSDNFNVTTNDANFEFTGLDLTEVIYSPDSVSGDSIDAAIERLLDAAENDLGYSENNEAYTKMLMARIHLGGTYLLYEGKRSKAKVGALLQTEIYSRRLRPSVTLSYNQSVGRWLNASVAYSMVNRGFNNLGVGISLNLGPVQVYAAADNILATRVTAFQNNGETQFVYPSNSTTTHIHAGLNLTFGRKRKDSDKDGVSDKRDECPDVFGLKEFRGCPDTDADGVQDSKDECPTTAGTVKGCPDTDEDGIIDKKDKCPTVKGIEKFEGCPDSDEDGIQDSEDDCPQTRGTSEMNGCPDKDGDKITDKKDNCPEVAGPKENKGCPWGDKDQDGILDNEDECPELVGPKENKGCPWVDKDKDGVLDKDDACPAVAGPKENKGCPFKDTDGDGVLDKDDACPLVIGIKENKGCPKIEKEEEEVLKRAFDNLEFESGKDIIKSTSYSSLNELAGLMTKKKEWKLKISGHTDNVGNDNNNMKLSEKRATAVKNFLISKGIAGSRLSALWFGETQPIAPNDTKEGRQKNRRVEMKIEF